MGIKSPIHIKILNDTLDIVTLMTHGYCLFPKKAGTAPSQFLPCIIPPERTSVSWFYL